VKTLALAFAVTLAAQQPPPTFRTTTDVVEVDVVVHDKTGGFVSDLSLGDFEVLDNGQPQQIGQIYLHLNEAGRRQPSGSEIAAESPIDLPALATRRAFVVVFDTDHLSSGGFKRVQRAAVTLFESQFTDGADFGAVLTNGRVVNNRLTSSRDEVLKALKAAKPSSAKTARIIDERQWPRMSDIEAIRIKVDGDQNVRQDVIRRALDDDPSAARVVESAVDVKAADFTATSQAQTNRTLQIAATLMNGLEKIPGRKTVLLLTEGFLADQSWPLVKDAVALAARADARVYTLDARGLDRGLRSGLDVNPGEDTSQRLLEQLDFGGDGMNSLAVDTGGFAVRNVNDFARAIGRIADDASNYYVLGYRPSAAPDGKFHSLTVRVNRREVSVRARRGYFATPRSVSVTTTAAAAPSPGRPEPDGPVRDSSRANAEPGGGTASIEPRMDSAPSRPDAVETAGVVTGATPAPGIRARPDAGKHVDTLLKGESQDAAAKAGWDAYQRGDLETARASLTVAAASPSARPWVHYALGLSDYALHGFHESAAEWEMVKEVAPEFEPVYFDLVDSYLQLRDPDQAVRTLLAAQARWPRDPDVFNALGVVQTSRGAIDDAVKSFQQAVTVAPQEAVGFFNLGHALEMRYYRSRRYIEQLRSWVSNDRDRRDAIENYQKYVSMGGPLEQSAQEGLTRLQWTPKP